MFNYYSESPRQRFLNKFFSYSIFSYITSMNFERGISPKESLNIGLPVYNMYRMLAWEDRGDGGAGLYIMNYEKTRGILEGIAKGKLSRSKYIIGFSQQYESLENVMEIPLHSLRTCILRYYNEDYVIKSHIE